MYSEVLPSSSSVQNTSALLLSSVSQNFDGTTTLIRSCSAVHGAIQDIVKPVKSDFTSDTAPAMHLFCPFMYSMPLSVATYTSSLHWLYAVTQMRATMPRPTRKNESATIITCS